MRVALVYDHINRFGGAERVLLVLHEIWPEAPLFTSVYDPKRAFWAKDFEVKASFLQFFPFAKTFHEIYPLFIPLAFESLKFENFDLVISVSANGAKGIITKPSCFHLCYCLTPTRYLWHDYETYFDNSLKKLIFYPAIKYLRKWDKIAAFRPDKIVAISETVKKRIKNYYHCDSIVIYPPVDLEKFHPGKESQKKDYFLVVSRLVKYKKTDLVIQAFNKLGWELKIVGIGPEYSNLKKIAKKNIKFLGQLTDKELLHYYQNCQAVIFPQEEDFGIVPLEAQACGKPVIAYGRGGALETVLGGKTGEFFYPQTVAALTEKLLEFRGKQYLAADCINQAKKFSKEKFKEKFRKETEKYAGGL